MFRSDGQRAESGERREECGELRRKGELRGGKEEEKDWAARGPVGRSVRRSVRRSIGTHMVSIVAWIGSGWVVAGS